MKTIFAAVLALFTFVSFAQTATPVQTIEMEVDGLVCAFCAQGIEKKLRKEAATEGVYVNLESRLVAVALKPGQDIADDKLKALLTESGYTIKAIKRSQTPLAKLKEGAS